MIIRITSVRRLLLAACIVGIPTFASIVDAQQSPAPVVRTGGREITIGGRVHAQLNTTSVDSLPPSEWILRRARLDVRVRVNELVTARVIPEFSGDRLSLKDAYIQFDFDPALAVLVGQAKRPFSLIELTSSALMLPIERGLRIRGVNGFDQLGVSDALSYSNRDIGLHVFGEPEGAPMGFTYAAAIVGGPLKGRVGNRETHQLAARVTAVPLNRLRLGAGWSSRDFARLGTAARAYDLQRGHAFEVDAEYGTFAPGFHAMGELSSGDYDPFSGDRFRGAQALAGYRTGSVGRWVTAVEPMVRVSHSSLEASQPQVAALGGTLFTPGVNIYFGTPNRIMFNYDLWSPDGAGSSVGSFKAMFQAVF